jgi:hypothetical protein
MTAESGPSVEFDVALTPDDHAALTLLIADRPDLKRRFRLQALGAVLWVPIVAIFAFAAFWALDSNRVPFADAIRFLPRLLYDELLWPMVAFLGFIGIVVLTRRRNVRGAVRRMAGGKDEPLEVNHFRVNDAGFHIERPYASSRYEWPAIRRVDRTATHIFLRINRLMCIVVPLRSLDAPKLAAVNALIDAHVKNMEPL